MFRPWRWWWRCLTSTAKYTTFDSFSFSETNLVELFEDEFDDCGKWFGGGGGAGKPVWLGCLVGGGGGGRLKFLKIFS